MLPAQVKVCVSSPLSRTMKLCLKKMPTKELRSKILRVWNIGRETSFGVNWCWYKESFLHPHLQTSWTLTQLTNAGLNSRHLLTMKNKITAPTHMFGSSAMTRWWLVYQSSKEIWPKTERQSLGRAENVACKVCGIICHSSRPLQSWRHQDLRRLQFYVQDTTHKQTEMWYLNGCNLS